LEPDPTNAPAAEIIGVAIFALAFPRVNRFERALHPFELSVSALPAFGMV
jgi:hypothetical protein